MRVTAGMYIFAILLEASVPNLDKHSWKKIKRSLSVPYEYQIDYEPSTTSHVNKLSQKRDFDPRLSQQAHARNKIEVLNKALRSFISILSFDDIGFLKEYKSLCEYVVDAEFSIDFIDPLDHSIKDDFLTSKSLFVSMTHTACLMKYFTLDETPAKGLVHKMMSLNIRLWSLRDSRGNPDPSVKDYKEIVHHYKYILYSWTVMFERSTYVPDFVRQMYDIHKSHAANMLNVLASHETV